MKRRARVTVDLHGGVQFIAENLHKTGLYGRSFTGTIRELLHRGIREALADTDEIRAPLNRMARNLRRKRRR